VVPIVGIVAGAVAAVLGARGLELGCAALAAASIVHALRALAGEEPAAIAGAAAGGLLAVVAIVEYGRLAHHGLAVPWLAIAAAAWTFAELARPTATPYVALAPAIAAALLEPAFVALPAIAGARLVRPSKEVLEAALRAQLHVESRPVGQLPLKGVPQSGPVKATASGPVKKPRGRESGATAIPKPPRPGLPPRWVIAVPIAGAILVVVAIVAGAARGGSFGSLGRSWFGPRLADAPPLEALAHLADALGPIAVVAVIGGLAVLARVHLASLAVFSCAIGSVLVDLRAGAPGAATLGLAALCAGVGVTRLAGTIRIRSGQAITAAMCGAILLVPPVWTAAELLAR
jgi:hypothetical protein